MPPKIFWVVKLTKPPAKPWSWPWPDDYFPRYFHFKADALTLQTRVREAGGEAILGREKMNAYSRPVEGD